MPAPARRPRSRSIGVASPAPCSTASTCTSRSPPSRSPSSPRCLPARPPPKSARTCSKPAPVRPSGSAPRSRSHCQRPDDPTPGPQVLHAQARGHEHPQGRHGGIRIIRPGSRQGPACGADHRGDLGVRPSFKFQVNLSRVGKGCPAGSIELRVSPSPSKIPYGGFSPVRLQMDRQQRPSTTSRA